MPTTYVHDGRDEASKKNFDSMLPEEDHTAEPLKSKKVNPKETRLYRCYHYIINHPTAKFLCLIVLPVLLLAIPIVFFWIFSHRAAVGRISVIWLFFWLELVWITIWLSIAASKFIPLILHHVILISHVQTLLEIVMEIKRHIAYFLWSFAIFVSFRPMLFDNAFTKSEFGDSHWPVVAFRILTANFIGSIILLIEKFVIQLLAVNFHESTYKDRIRRYKSNIRYLAILYRASKKVLPRFHEDVDNIKSVAGNKKFSVIQRFAEAKFSTSVNFLSSGEGLNRYQNLVQTALSDPITAAGVAHRFFKTFGKGTETIYFSDILEHIHDRDLTSKIFAMFDADYNGDINLQEMEMFCIEVGQERTSILRSLRDVDSAVAKFDRVLVSIIGLITLIIFAELMSTAFQALISSASTTLLALSWLFSATAQELLSSVIFVFAKHPFDVEDIVEFTGGTYVVKEMQLLATVFTQTDGKVVQIPNSVLNTYPILNIRRSDKIGEGINIKCWFGTPFEDIEALRLRLVAFVQSNRKHYDPTVTISITEFPRLELMKINIWYTHRTNWQNRGMYLRRRALFYAKTCEIVRDLGLSLSPPEGPRKYPKLTVPKVPLDLPPEETVPREVYAKLVKDRLAYMSQIRGKDLHGKIDNSFGYSDTTQLVARLPKPTDNDDNLDSDIESEIDSDISTDSDAEKDEWVDDLKKNGDITHTSKSTIPVKRNDAVISMDIPHVPHDAVGMGIHHSQKMGRPPPSGPDDLEINAANQGSTNPSVNSMYSSRAGSSSSYTRSGH